MKNIIGYLTIAALTVCTVVINSTALAQGQVQFNLEARGAGSGYNNSLVDRRVKQPRSILKHSAANRSVHNERRFMRQLGPEVRQNMRQRGDIARHARRSGEIKSTLNRTARAPKVRPNTHKAASGLSHELGHRGSATRKASTRSAKTSRLTKSKNALKTVKNGKKLRTLGKVAAGGVVVAGGTYVAETALGVDIPDAIDAAEWTYGTLKDPRKAPQRISKLGKDSVRTIHKAGRTLTNPKKMGKNLEKGAKKTGKSIKKAGCSVGKLFGAKCR